MASNEGTDAAAAAASSYAEPADAAAIEAGGQWKHPSSGAAPSEVITDGLRVDLLMNARYHSAREAFLDTVHRVFMFLVIVLGTGVVVDLGAKEVMAAVAAILAALDLTFDLSNRARAHALMKRRYFELLADLSEGRKSEVEIVGCMHRYSADEEPAYHALIALAWNAAQEMVYGSSAHSYRVPLIARWLKNIWRFSGASYALERSSPSSAPARATSAD